MLIRVSPNHWMTMFVIKNYQCPKSLNISPED